MKRFTLAAVLAVLLLGSALPAQAQWLVETSLTSAVYHGHSPADPRASDLGAARWSPLPRPHLALGRTQLLTGQPAAGTVQHHDEPPARVTSTAGQLPLAPAQPPDCCPYHLGASRPGKDRPRPRRTPSRSRPRARRNLGSTLTYATLSFAPEGPRLKTGVMFSGQQKVGPGGPPHIWRPG